MIMEQLAAQLGVVLLLIALPTTVLIGVFQLLAWNNTRLDRRHAEAVDRWLSNVEDANHERGNQ